MTATAVRVESTPGVIGPNAVLQVDAALRAVGGEALSRRVFGATGLTRHLDAPPTQMVDEREAAALQAALRRTLGVETALAISDDAGRRTGDYLLAHRIPRPAQFVLRRLPARAASALLLRAIGGHAWTFAGSGAFSWSPGPPLVLTIVNCPLCADIRAKAPACAFYRGTFERLYRALVHPDTTVRETTCQAAGADACRFEVRWDWAAAAPPGR